MTLPSFLKAHNTRLALSITACLALFVGLICSKFLLTISMILMLLTGLLHPELKQNSKNIVNNKAYLATIGVFLLFLYGVLLSSDIASSVERLRIALPYLVLPLAFALSPAYSQRLFKKLIYVYILAIFLCCIGVLINFYADYDAIQIKLKASQAVPTPNKDHIRFSLMINLAVFGVFWLLEQGFVWYKKGERILLVLVAAFMVLCLHIVSVRTGLLVFYVGTFVTVLYLIIKKRAIIIGLIMLTGIVFLPQLAYKNIPSLQTKVKLSIYNWQRFQKGYIKDSKLSDIRRFISYKIAWEIAQKNLWTGVGIGDLKNEQAKIYARDYPEQKIMYPHNFYLTILAATGIPGLLFFLICFFLPLFYRQHYKNLFFLLFFVCISLSLLTENTLLIAIGVALHSGFLCICLHAISGSKQEATKLK